MFFKLLPATATTPVTVVCPGASSITMTVTVDKGQNEGFCWPPHSTLAAIISVPDAFLGYANYAMGPHQLSFLFQISVLTNFIMLVLLTVFAFYFQVPMWLLCSAMGAQLLGFAPLQSLSIYHWQTYVPPQDGHGLHQECMEWLLLPDGSIPFLDVLIIPDEEGNLKTTVYRKPTHTNLYLQWDGNHQVSSKYSVIGSLQYRAKTICPDKEMLRSEEHHLEEAPTRYKYPTWALNKAKMKTKTAANRNNKRNNKITNNNIQRPTHLLYHTYYQGISESIKKACSEYGVQVYFKGGNTIKNLLMAPKDQDAI